MLTMEIRRAIGIACLVFVLSFFFCLPYWFKFELIDGDIRETGVSDSALFKTIVHFWMYLPIAYTLPFSILIISNTYLLVKLISVKRRRLNLFRRMYQQSVQQ